MFFEDCILKILLFKGIGFLIMMLRSLQNSGKETVFKGKALLHYGPKQERKSTGEVHACPHCFRSMTILAFCCSVEEMKTSYRFSFVVTIMREVLGGMEPRLIATITNS